ncbi:MAG: HIT domain-containing protein [Verrucomicrobia bacterium]|nr:HIT domain-containing protein [Verrucomicrobiota bacterium]
MEPLHAPWRIAYILAPKEPAADASLFTRIAQSGDDEANYVIVRDRTCYAVLNRYPYNGGHLMVVPYKQVPDFNGLTDGELSDLMLLARRCQNALTDVMKPDTNFMPVLANTSVVPEALAELAAKLRAALAK